jgi:hypothetical protein
MRGAYGRCENDIERNVSVFKIAVLARFEKLFGFVQDCRVDEDDI